MICPNPNCGRIVSPFDETCQHCGTPLKSNPIKDYEKKADHIVKDAEARAEDIKEEIRNGFKGSPQARTVGYEKQSLPGENHGISLEKGYEEKELDSKKLRQMPDFTIRTRDLLKFIRQRKDVRLHEMKSLVFGSPYVTGQEERRSKIELTDFRYRKEAIEDEESFVVNAFAFYNANRGRYEIHVLDGYLNFLLAVESFFRVRKEDILIGLFFKMLEGKGKLLLSDTVDIIEKYGQPDDHVFVDIVEKAFVPCSDVIAHELGHICHGHCRDENLLHYYDVDKNDERSADDFASSVRRSLFDKSLQETLLIAEIKCDFAWALRDRFYKDILTIDIKGGTHPLSDERIRNSLRASKDLAEEMGISEEWYSSTMDILMVKIKQRLEELRKNY